MNEMYGEYTNNLDAQKRIAMPAPFRQALGDCCYVTISFVERCLNVYNEESWNNLRDKFDALPESDKVAQNLKRLVIGHAQRCEFDSQGRIKLIANQVKYAQLNKACTVVGMSNKLEIWNHDIYEEKVLGEMDDLQCLAESVGAKYNGAL